MPVFKKLELVDDLTAHLKRYSVICLAALLGIQPVWVALDGVIRDGLPVWFVQGVNMTLALAGLIGALLKQKISTESFFAPPKNDGDA